MSQQQQPQPQQQRAMAWDPTCPASCLLLLSATNNDNNSNSNNNNTNNNIAVDFLYSDTGAMLCNAHELAALHVILKAHDEYHADMMQMMTMQQQDDISSSNMSMLQAFQSLSRACRAAVLQCCEGWEQEIIMQQQQQQQLQEHPGESSSLATIQESMVNLELLKKMHGILHLSDVFLPLLPSTASSSISSHFGSFEEDLFEKPGAVTADTIRYLRYNHHFSHANHDMHPSIATMLDPSRSRIPEDEYDQVEIEVPSAQVPQDDEHGNGSNNSSKMTVNLYWWYISTLVKRGCLEQVWETLQLHSLYRAAMDAVAMERQQQQGDDGFLQTDNDAEYLRAMKKVRHGFFILRMILLRAPLPAGRNDEYDEALGTPDFQDQNDDDIDSYYNDIDDMEEGDYYEQVLQSLDVSPRAYKLWETTSATSDSSAAGTGAAEMDMPLFGNAADAAMRKHATWQRFVQDLRPHFHLSRRIPGLDAKVLAILAGDFDNAAYRSNAGGVGGLGVGSGGGGSVQFATWMERLCAELLYKRPNLSPRELHGVTRRFMKQFLIGKSASIRQMNDNGTTMTTMDQLLERSPMAVVILQIMQGHAGQAIETMYLLGGGSGAALPATLTALLYAMFLESNIMPPESSFRKTEFICQAASAIVSSLGGLESKRQHQQHVHDAGAHLAIQLLLPYTWPTSNDTYDNDNEYDSGDKTARTQIIALIANILEHYNPRSESASCDLIDMCMPLLAEQQSVVILEACVSVILCRYRKALKDQDELGDASYSSTAMQWLWQGMQLEAMVLQPEAAMMTGTCHRTLFSWCYQTAFDLLNSSAKVSVVHPLTFQAATEMVKTVRKAALGDDARNGTHKVSPLKIAQVRQLVCIQELFEAFSLQGDYSRAAEKVVESLQSTTTPSDGVATLVPFSMYLPLLQIAQQILEREEATHEWTAQKSPSCAFDKWGVSVLMETLLRVTVLSPSSSSSATTTTHVMTQQQEMELRKLLARALARAFVVENAKKKTSFLAAQQQQQRQHLHDGVDIASIRPVHLSQYPPSIQEAVVQRMLDM